MIKNTFEKIKSFLLVSSDVRVRWKFRCCSDVDGSNRFCKYTRTQKGYLVARFHAEEPVERWVFVVELIPVIGIDFVSIWMSSVITRENFM